MSDGLNIETEAKDEIWTNVEGFAPQTTRCWKNW